MQITTDDLLQAAQIEERGMLDRKERSFETWKQVAINEAAMAVAAVNFPDLKNIEFVCTTHESSQFLSLAFTVSNFLLLSFTSLAPYQISKINVFDEISTKPHVNNS